MAEAEKKESARTTIYLALATVVVGMYALFFGLQTLIFFEADHWGSESPYLRIVPQPLTSSAISPAQEKAISFYGFQFDAPWKGEAKQTEGPQSSRADFSSGAVVAFFNPEGERDIVAGLRNGNPQTYNNYQALFGQGAFPDNYALYAAVYGASPSQTAIFGSRSKDLQMSTLLLWKLAFGTTAGKTIYTLQSGDWRGFQFGDPASSYAVLLQLFDEHDKQVRMIVASKTGQPGTISQADINCILNSLKPVEFGAPPPEEQKPARAPRKKKLGAGRG